MGELARREGVHGALGNVYNRIKVEGNSTWYHSMFPLQLSVAL